MIGILSYLWNLNENMNAPITIVNSPIHCVGIALESNGTRLRNFYRQVVHLPEQELL